MAQLPSLANILNSLSPAGGQDFKRSPPVVVTEVNRVAGIWPFPTLLFMPLSGGISSGQCYHLDALRILSHYFHQVWRSKVICITVEVGGPGSGRDGLHLGQ
jgi:hypothetical protein